MKYIGVDYGKARIGVAKSDALGFLASPIGTIHEKNFRIQLDKLCEIIEKEKPDKLIFGLPKNMDGTEGESAELVREFSEKHLFAQVCLTSLWTNVFQPYPLTTY